MSLSDWSLTDWPLTVHLATRWFDNDVYGHLHNTVHDQLFDTAVNGHLLACGALEPDGAHLLSAVESGCRYHVPLIFPQIVTVGLRIARLGMSSVRWRIALYGAGDTPAAAGHFVHVHVHRADRQPCPLTDTARAALQPPVQ